MFNCLKYIVIKNKVVYKNLRKVKLIFYIGLRFCLGFCYFLGIIIYIEWIFIVYRFNFFKDLNISGLIFLEYRVV